MAESSHIEVEVIVWDGALSLKNPFGHVSTKITKNGIPYSYSLEAEHTPKNVCNTQPFQILRAHEQGLRDGVGFVLNVSQEQAKEIFLTMNTIFTSYNKPGCVYKTLHHNCTFAIQNALKKAKIDLYIDLKKIKKLEVNDHGITKTILPALIEEGLLKTKNCQGDWLVKDIVQYKKGNKQGVLVHPNQEKFFLGIKLLHYKASKEKVLFGIHATHDNKGWHTEQEAPMLHFGNEHIDLKINDKFPYVGGGIHLL